MHHKVIVFVCVAILAAMFMCRIESGDLYISGFGGITTCALHRYLEIKCALCGMSRSFCLLARGEFMEGFRYHSVGPFLLLLVILQIPYRAWAIISRAESAPLLIRARKINSISTITIASALFINWLIYLGGIII